MDLAAGDVVADVEATVCDGETFRSRQLSSVLGDRGGVLVSTGFAFSAIARNWWKRFARAGWQDFEGVAVVGVSRDGPYAQNAFLRELGSPDFQFVADVDGAVTEALGLRTEREGMAGISTPWRAVVVLDPERAVRYIHVADDWISPLPREDVEAAVDEL